MSGARGANTAKAQEEAKRAKGRWGKKRKDTSLSQARTSIDRAAAIIPLLFREVRCHNNRHPHFRIRLCHTNDCYLWRTVTDKGKWLHRVEMMTPFLIGAGYEYPTAWFLLDLSDGTLDEERVVRAVSRAINLLRATVATWTN